MVTVTDRPNMISAVDCEGYALNHTSKLDNNDTCLIGTSLSHQEGNT